MTISRRDIVVLAATILVVVSAFMILRGRIAVTDIDAINYIEGAYSIQQRGQYESLEGIPITHWPPGYSTVLAQFPDPLDGAYLVNMIALGASVAAVWIMAAAQDWNLVARTALALILGLGFFRSVAISAKPDILTYALFLFAAYLFLSSRPMTRMVSYGLFALLVPLKLISVVFIPAALIVVFLRRKSLQPAIYEYLVGLAVLALAITSVVLFNYATTGSGIPSSHGIPSVQSLANSLKQFAFSLPREFFATWYGTLNSPQYLIAFGTLILVAFGCFITLRYKKENRTILMLGLAVFLLSWGLSFVRTFYMDSRLLGYGLVLMVVSFQPRRVHSILWSVYAAGTLALFVYNSSVHNSYGLNDPRYNEAVATAVPLLPEGGYSIFSNADRLLGVLGRIPSTFTASAETIDTASEEILVYFEMPNYDAIMTPITQFSVPNEVWCEIGRSDNVIIFEKCLEATSPEA